MYLLIKRFELVCYATQAWCHDNFIHIRNMSTVLDVRRQLCELCQREGVRLCSGGADCGEAVRQALIGGLFTNVAEHIGEGKYLTVSVHVQLHVECTDEYRCTIARFYLSNACLGPGFEAIVQLLNIYTPTPHPSHSSQLKTRQQVAIHPSSCLFHVKPHPALLLYSELVHTSKCYMR